MTINVETNAPQRSTPPKGRTVREMFLDYVRKLRGHYDEAAEIEREYALLVPKRYSSNTLAKIACSSDPRWQQAVADEQFAERLANTYGQVAVLNAIERLLSEQQKTNSYLERLTNPDRGFISGIH